MNDISQQSASLIPSQFVIDRVYIHGDSTSALKRGIYVNSSWTAIVDSYISDVHVVGQDSQAIGVSDSPGPVKIVNNYLEASTENTMVGGADPATANLIPSDIEFRNNYSYKPRSWRIGDVTYAGNHWAVKNLFELKNAQRVLIENNIFDGNWVDGQVGRAILFTPRNQDGACSWCVVTDVTFQNNIVRHSAAGLNILGHDDAYPSGLTQRIKVYNNIWEDINGSIWNNGDGAWAMVVSGINSPGPSDVQLTHNTIFQTGRFLAPGEFYSPSTFSPKPNVVITDNISLHNDYGVLGDNDGVGNATLDHYFPGGVFTKNILMGGPAASYSSYPGNFFPANWSTVFVNQAAGDYHVLSSSPYHNAGTDGKDLGADIDVISTNTVNVITGRGLAAITPPSPTPPPLPADTIPPVVSAFDVQPRVGTGTLTATTQASDTGGSYLASAELWRSPYNSATCHNSNKSGCIWSQSAVTPAPAQANTWSIVMTDSPPIGSYVYGVHVVDGAGNVGTETSLIQVTVNSPQQLLNRAVTIGGLNGRNTKAVTATIDELDSFRNLIKSYPAIFDSNGNASVSFDPPAQSVFLRLKARPFLPRIISVDLNSTGAYAFPKLLIGDINQDSIINSVDFSFLNSKWFQADANSDLNQDGIVNSLDFSLLNGNWFVAGE
jgi:hypothetical protein